MDFHSGRLQVLHVKWTFPKINVKQLINNWFAGNKKESVPPLKLLEPLRVHHLGTATNNNTGQIKLRQIKCVMKLIEDYVKSEEVYDDDHSKWTQECTTNICEAVGDKYLHSRFSVNLTAEMSWKKLYSKMAKVKAFNNGNQDGLINGII